MKGGSHRIWSDLRKLIVGQMVRLFLTGATTKFQLKKGLTLYFLPPPKFTFVEKKIHRLYKITIII